MAILGMVGKTFGKLTVTKFAGRDKHGHFLWDCTCFCGGTNTVAGYSLRQGTSTSCGCTHYDVLKKHEMCGTRVYMAWVNMTQRCNNPKHPSYKNYGGRGITVCDRWQEFNNFFADMGHPPNGTSIERKNNSLGYSPENCVWATRKQQRANQRLTTKEHVGFQL